MNHFFEFYFMQKYLSITYNLIYQFNMYLYFLIFIFEDKVWRSS